MHNIEWKFVAIFFSCKKIYYYCSIRNNCIGSIKCTSNLFIQPFFRDSLNGKRKWFFFPMFNKSIYCSILSRIKILRFRSSSVKASSKLSSWFRGNFVKLRQFTAHYLNCRKWLELIEQKILSLIRVDNLRMKGPLKLNTSKKIIYHIQNDSFEWQYELQCVAHYFVWHQRKEKIA